MIHRPLFETSGKGFKFFTFVFLLLFGLVAGMVSGTAVIAIFYGSDIDILTNIEAARTMQIATQLGLFVIPPIGFALLFFSQPFTGLGFVRNKSLRLWLPALLLMIVSLPLVHQLASWNAQLKLPQFLAGLENWMQAKEASAERLTRLFLEVKNLNGLIINLMMIALIPSIGEELVFRSVLQPLFVKLFRNIHLGILFGALVFSVMHFQFYGLLPRFVLGVFLGYLFYWSGSIWIPVAMHLFNNGMAVIAFYLHHNEFTDIPMEDFGATGSSFLVFLSLLMSGFLLMLAFRWRKIEQTE